MKYAIIGAGAIGGYYGGKLANAGKDVHFLFNSDYKFVKKNGLKVDSIDGSFIISPVNAYQQSEDMPKCDVVLVALKTTNNHLTKDLITPLLHDETVVVLIQNGLGMESDLQALLPNTHIAGGIAFICSNKVGEGHIAHMDGGQLDLCAYGKCSKVKLLDISSDLQEAGIEAEVSDLNTARWKKLVWNIPFNGLTVVMNATTKDLVSNKYSKKLLHDIMDEIILAAHHSGVDLLPKLAEQVIADTEKMFAYSPSMKVDFENQRPLETFYLYTRPITEAVLNGVEMPRVSMLEKQLRYIEAGYKK